MCYLNNQTQEHLPYIQLLVVKGRKLRSYIYVSRCQTVKKFSIFGISKWSLSKIVGTQRVKKTCSKTFCLWKQCNIGLYKLLNKKKFKGLLSGLRRILTTESSLKMMKNTFEFTSKAPFVLKIFKFLS